MLASIKEPVDFIDSCLKFGDKAKIDFRKIGSIALLKEIDEWKRARLFIYYNDLLDTFENRVKFILDTIKKRMNRLDILDQIFRGLIELYCRLLFVVKSEEVEKFRKIIWKDLITYSNFSVPTQSAHQSSPLIRINYRILESLGEDISALDISVIKKELSDQYENMKESKKLKELIRRMNFPGVRRILLDYYDEKESPVILKKDLYRLYSRLSEQIHGNIYYELPDLPINNTIFRTLATVILIQIKLYKEISTITHNEIEFLQLLKEFQSLNPDFSHLWYHAK